ncbi:hypothetical protein ACH4T9_26590 [Micromonospora sp. NPDC020750]|uniref:hypothetical protein n=1 Tax=unclassified Micromonospora TaxID=2617518 RepID=UPI00378EADB7
MTTPSGDKAPIPKEKWWSETESPKAWMSVRDADLYEALLHRVAELRAGEPLRVVEWGAGRSTLWYTSFLAALGVPYRWLALEHHGQFFQESLAPQLNQRPDAVAVDHDDADTIRALLAANNTVAVGFGAGDLRPFLPGREADRHADLDAYVSLPRRLGLEWDMVVIDGRKRRRCVLEALDLLNPAGFVLLHDAWRTHYQCAWSEWTSGRRFGDEWWIGSRADTDFTDVLPWHAFERHAELP